jgi:hypothetical protein
VLGVGALGRVPTNQKLLKITRKLRGAKDVKR